MKSDKRIIKLGFLISLFVLFFIPSAVKAEVNFNIKGPDSVTPGSTVEYAIELKSDETDMIKGFEASVNFESNVLTLKNIKLGSGWSGNTEGGSSGKSVKFESEVGNTGTFTVATLVFSVNTNATSNSAYVTLKDAKYTINEAATTLSEKTHNIKVKSGDNTLSDLKVNGARVEGFSPTVYEYEMSVGGDIATAKINATTNSTKATFKSGNGNRTVNLNYGSNVIKVVVISESGIEKTYTLNITREDTRSTDATLSSITVDGKEISNFKSTTYKYTIKKYKATSVKILGIPADMKATVKVDGPAEMVVGENTYTIVVTSESGATATYTVIINNIDTAINKKLKTLSVKGYDIDFDRNNNRYEIMYNKSKFKKLHIYFTTMAASDEVTAVLSPDINNDSEALKNLKVGDEITITVTGIDGEKSEYTIVVVKDSRISFFLVLELFLMAVIAIIIFVVFMKRKNAKNGKGKNYKTTKVAKKEEKEKPEKTTRTRSNSENAVPIVEGEKPKKRRRFSIYEDEYEEVEVEVDDDEYSTTKELTDEELNLK